MTEVIFIAKTNKIGPGCASPRRRGLCSSPIAPVTTIPLRLHCSTCGREMAGNLSRSARIKRTTSRPAARWWFFFHASPLPHVISSPVSRPFRYVCEGNAGSNEGTGRPRLERLAGSPVNPPGTQRSPQKVIYTPCGLPCVLALPMARPAGFYSLAPSCVPSWAVWPPSTTTTSTPAAAASAVAASTVPTFSPASS